METTTFQEKEITYGRNNTQYPGCITHPEVDCVVQVNLGNTISFYNWRYLDCINTVGAVAIFLIHQPWRKQFGETQSWEEEIIESTIQHI